jgi:predicted nucleic acid-binding protein
MKEKYVIDANVLFGAFISGKDIYQFLFSEKELYLPDFAFLELEKYEGRILKKTKLRDKELSDFVITLLSKVTVIPSFLILKASFTQAYPLCKDIDEKNTVYVALAIELGFKLVTNDKKLYDGLESLNFNQVVLLKDVMEH